jgi:uncharacterized protein (DUF362 family)
MTHNSRKPDSALPSDGSTPSSTQRQFDRRALLAGGAVAIAGAVAWPLLRRRFQTHAPVFIARNQNYDGLLAQTIRDGLLAVGFEPDKISGRTVLLKPNLVEPTRGVPQMTTNPAVIVAAAQVFRDWGAIVLIGEAPGHMRDTEMVLAVSGVQDALDDLGLDFSDLNYSELGWVDNGGRASKLAGFHFPAAALEADLIVSMPKMKTHHWVGYTGALKNLYGVIPGIKYGWPKNVLHYAGIPQTIFDINASLPKTIAIVDGIQAMEGDGPIMGSPKEMGLIVIGLNSTAVDATLGRVMGFDPAKVEYLQLAAGRLGPVDEHLIAQRGEAWRTVASGFKMIDAPHLRGLRSGVLVT